MALIRKRGEKGLTPVKNLGWLIRHSSLIRTMTVETSDYPLHGEVFLLVELVGTVDRFSTFFASRAVCRHWLQTRRTFKGLSVDFEGEKVQL